VRLAVLGLLERRSASERDSVAGAHSRLGHVEVLDRSPRVRTPCPPQRQTIVAGGVLGKNIWGPSPSSFGRQQQLSEITIEPITSNV